MGHTPSWWLWAATHVREWRDACVPYVGPGAGQLQLEWLSIKTAKRYGAQAPSVRHFRTPAAIHMSPGGGGVRRSGHLHPVHGRDSIAHVPRVSATGMPPQQPADGCFSHASPSAPLAYCPSVPRGAHLCTSCYCSAAACCWAGRPFCFWLLMCWASLAPRWQ